MENKERTPVPVSDTPLHPENSPSAGTFRLSETWAQDAQQDLEDFIESQGIYIRQ